MSVTMDYLHSLSPDARLKLAETEKDQRTLGLLSQDTYWKVRLAVARNPATPSSILDVLASDPNHDVAWSARGN